MPRGVFSQDPQNDIPLKKRIQKLLRDTAELYHVDTPIDGSSSDILVDYDKLIEALYTYLVYIGEFKLDLNRDYIGGENIVAKTLLSGKKILFLLRRLDFRELAKTQIEQLAEYFSSASNAIDSINKTLADIENSAQPPSDQTKAVVEQFNTDFDEMNNTFSQQLTNIGALNRMRLDNLARRRGGGRSKALQVIPKRFL